MASFQLLGQREEDELHKTRILNIEEKPFKRITKRLLAPGALTSTPLSLPPTPPPDTVSTPEAAAEQEATQQKQLDERRQFQEDVLLDFAAFDSSIARFQFLRNSNERERERYAAEKLRILEAAQDVKYNTAELRVKLESARATLDQRKGFDKLAEKITSNRMLRTREEQAANLLKLEEECRELEREREQYGETWAERREQFGRIVEEGVRLRRLIRDEKEEVERREGMGDAGEEDNEVGEAGSRDGQTPKHDGLSGEATPRPDGASTPRARGASTEAESTYKSSKLKPVSNSYSRSNSRASSRAGSRGGSRPGSRAASPTGSERRGQVAEEGDAVMADAAVDSPMADADSAVEEGEEVEIPKATVHEPSASSSGEDKMDTT
ncbi:hypothetical protein VC83_07966 [Pseudogymnoascus destructans]|uniref:Tho complex subunit 7 n=2 Tax=Pseudogymnoascus destructans TaxID=655981 RepID=L8FXA9_PSED2|nr:uncharacterized protein VC83_07966 [Pseudogymnoascus destructans]ELR05123.1 hypothetical protein GMDG_07165 [Pseudogymnoascus destructans 20631-21]OAF55913.1 hypothetical protein VC83_07966 [Pseudogymnoascus destructans]